MTVRARSRTTLFLSGCVYCALTALLFGASPIAVLLQRVLCWVLVHPLSIVGQGAMLPALDLMNHRHEWQGDAVKWSLVSHTTIS